MYERRLWKQESLSVGAPLEDLEGRFVYRGLQETVKEGFIEALWGEPGGGLIYWGPQRIYKGRLWRQAYLSIGAPLGKLEGRFVYQGLRETVNKGSRNRAFLCLWGLCEGNLERWLVNWGSWRIRNERLWKRASFYIGALLGEQGRDAALLETLREGEILIYQEVLFIRESERYVKIKALETGNSLHSGPSGGLWETVKECLINRASLFFYMSSVRGA